MKVLLYITLINWPCRFTPSTSKITSPATSGNRQQHRNSDKTVSFASETEILLQKPRPTISQAQLSNDTIEELCPEISNVAQYVENNTFW